MKCVAAKRTKRRVVLEATCVVMTQMARVLLITHDVLTTHIPIRLSFLVLVRSKSSKLMQYLRFWMQAWRDVWSVETFDYRTGHPESLPRAFEPVPSPPPKPPGPPALPEATSAPRWRNKNSLGARGFAQNQSFNLREVTLLDAKHLSEDGDWRAACLQFNKEAEQLRYARGKSTKVLKVNFSDDRVFRRVVGLLKSTMSRPDFDRSPTCSLDTRTLLTTADNLLQTRGVFLSVDPAADVPPLLQCALKLGTRATRDLDGELLKIATRALTGVCCRAFLRARRRRRRPRRRARRSARPRTCSCCS